MQLWKKNYLFVYTLFIIIINTSFIYIISSNFSQEFQREVSLYYNEEKSVIPVIDNMFQMKNKEDYLIKLGEQYVNSDRFLSLIHLFEGSIYIDMQPTNNWELTESDVLQLIKRDNKQYFSESRTITIEDDTFTFIFTKDISYLYQGYRKRLVTFMCMSIILMILLGTMLYITMKRINRPVSNIAHEIKTPLTNIQGYAQYMMAGNLSKEDQFFANEYILKEVHHLKEIVENLLIMGGIRDGKLLYENIPVRLLLDELTKQFPKLEIENELSKIYCDKTLMLSLLVNLTANAVRVSNHTKIIINREMIKIWNDGPLLDNKTIKSLNGNFKISKGHMNGNGLGVNLCHEIAKLHKSKLKFYSNEEEGTYVIITLSDRN